ncbi:hypothetical protein MACJ_002228 [Theileria orientalis]|uniref:Uncharacterized protein n=1 Tax=Theileria orientalis TaxID=68886 RepID=A0A976M792_THEOR|nr:hypothetical protein MACJ_002228 [Theileria orientalis]
MVSFAKVYLGFLGLPMISHRSNLPISFSNYKNNIKPVGLSNPLSKFNQIFEKETLKPLVPKDLTEKILFGLRSDRDCGFDTYSELNELDSVEKKEEFITNLLSEWNEKKLDLSISSLMSFKRLVEYIQVPYDNVYSSLQKIFRECNNRYSLDYILVLKHIFKRSGQVSASDDYHDIYKSQDLDTNVVLRLAKGSLISDEFMSILNGEMEQFQLDNEVTYPKTLEEYRTFKKKLIDMSTNRVDFEEFPNYKIKQLSYVLYNQIWMIDYFKNRQMPKLPEEVMQILEVDEPYCKLIYSNLIQNQIDSITLEQIPHIVGKQTKVHRYLAHRKFLEAQLKFTLEEFKKFKERSNATIKKLEEKVGDVAKFPVEYKPFGTIGGEMPFVNLEVLVPGDKEMEKKCAEEATQDGYDDIDPDQYPKTASEMTREEVEERRREIKKAEEELRIVSHLSQKDKADFYLNKVPSAVEAAKRAKQRRKLLEEVGNPFNTRSDLEEWAEHEARMNPVEKKEKEVKMTDEEYARDKLAEIRTEYLRYLMQIDNLRWNLKSSSVSPVETFGKLYESGESVIRPKAKKLDFTLPVYEECFSMLDSFLKKNLDSEANKFRRKMFKEALGNRRNTEKNSADEMVAFPGDPLIKNKDIPMLKVHVHTGGRLCVQSSMKPNMRSLSDSQKRTNFYRITSSQPSEMRRCRKCEAVVFVGPLRTLEGDFFEVPQSHTFRIRKDFKCHNCGADKSELEETWPTGERGYKPVEYLAKEKQHPPLDAYGYPLFDQSE